MSKHSILKTVFGTMYAVLFIVLSSVNAYADIAPDPFGYGGSAVNTGSVMILIGLIALTALLIRAFFTKKK